MFKEAHSTHDFINGCKSSADAALNANIRKVAGFQVLHELALLKELQAEPRTLSLVPASKKTPQPAGGPSKKSVVTRQSQLGGAYAQNDVLAINQEKKGKGKAHHSGYAGSLPDGVYQKVWLVTPSLPTAVSAVYSQPPTVTGINAGLYFSDIGSKNSHSDDVSNANATPDANPNASSPQNPISTAFPTASDATDVFLSLSETDSSGSHGGSNANANTVSDSDNTFSPELTTSQIENPLLLVSHCPSIVMWTLVMLMTLGCLALMIWTLRTMNDAHLFHVYTVHELIVIISLLFFLVCW